MAELSVQLTAEIKQLERQLERAKKALNSTGQSAERAAKDVNKVGGEGSQGLNKLKKSTANTTPTLLEFNRTIQDAPFGIQGVANNIQQLTANFGDLRQQAGSTSATFGLLAKGLIGPQGILLGISLVTSLLVTYSDKLFKTKSLTDDLTKATKEFAGGAKSEISTLQTLLSVVSDETETREKRNQAVQVLQNKYPEYLKNLNTENSTTKKIKESVDSLTKSIETRAKVQGAQSLITKKAEELFLKQTEAQEDYQKAIDNIPASLERQRQAYNAYSRGIGGVSFDREKSEERLQEIALKRQKNTLSQAEKEYSKYVDNLKKIISDSPDLLSAFDVDPENIKQPDVSKSDSLKPVIDPKEYPAIFGITPEAQENLAASARSLSETVNNELKNSSTPIKAYTSRIEEALIDFNSNVGFIIENGIANTFAGIGRAIGQTFAEGTSILEGLGKTLLSSLGSVLISLGQLAIETGVGILAVQIALQSLNPYVAIAAGIALVAIGSAFSSGSKNIGSNNFGGSSVGGQGSRSSSSGSFSTSGGANFSGGGGTVVFEIQGQKLVGVLRNTLNSNARLGGNLSLS
jgi:tetratricopeptide (TPR) repeat protein